MSANTLPSADCRTDHELLVANMRVKFTTKDKDRMILRRYILDDMRSIPDQYTIAMKSDLEQVSKVAGTSEEMWLKIKEMMLQAAEKQLPKMLHKKKVPWLSLAALEITDRRRERRRMGGDREEISGLNSQFQRQARKVKEAYIREM